MIDIFLNDYYRLLKLLYENQYIVLDKKIVPLTQLEISDELKMSKAKVNTLFIRLQKEGFIIQESRGKYFLSDSAKYIVNNIEKIESTLIKHNGEKNDE